MPVNPIDLQTLYVHMHQHGKDQANSRQAVIHAQEVQAQKLIKEDQNKINAVNEMAPADEENMGIQKDKHNPPDQEASGKKGPPDKDQEAPPPEKERFQDPQLGSHIDITG